MGGQACKCDRPDQYDDGHFEVKTAVEVRLEAHGTTEFDASIAVTPDYFDSLQWTTASDPCTETGIAAPTDGLCDSWMEHLTDQEIQQLEADAICAVEKHVEDRHELSQPYIIEDKGGQLALSSLVGDASFQLSLEKRNILELHMDTVAGGLAGGVQSAEACVLSTELSQCSTQPSENNLPYSPKDGFQEASGDVNISEQCGCMSAISNVHYKDGSESNSDSGVQAQLTGANQRGCQGHELQGDPFPQHLAQVEGVADVTMQHSQPSKLHHISAWYHVCATEEEDSDGTEAVQATRKQSAECDAARHPQLPSPKQNTVKSSSRRPSHARARAATRGEDVLLW